MSYLRVLSKPPRASAIAVLLAVTVGACGSNEPESSGSSAAQPLAAADQAAIRRLELGLATKPPSSGPKAQGGKKVWVISCGELLESCTFTADAHVEAVEAIGWQVTRFDAKLDPARAAEGIRQAIADKADAVIVSTFDCVQVKSPLRDAKRAGVATYGAFSTNCDDPVGGDGSAPLYTLVEPLPPGRKPGWLTRGWGIDKGLYTAAETKGKAKAINIKVTDIPNVELISAGFEEGLERCRGCKVIDTVETTAADAATAKLTQAVTQALVANPRANVLHMPVDATLPTVEPAIRESGRTDLRLIGGEGLPSSIEVIRKGGVQDATFPFDLGWESWAQVDNLNRYFAGQEQVHGGWGYTVVDADTNLPKSGGFESTSDYRAAYRSIWGR